ncbi:MAG: DTW domain-containing protein [Alphaproteobacteria bacterium]|nr:DTW domain-containing protein [Alphaproteobacteria bacterium]
MSAVAPIRNQTRVLVLQHPQEAKQELGTGRLTVESLAGAVLRVGLSWPNLGRALGEPADPRHWAVLYLGAAKDQPPEGAGPVIAVDRKGRALADQQAALSGIAGIVLLDGNWSQAKAMWWRNSWLLKLRRLVLRPDRPSAYGELRREPRRISLATIEAAALCLGVLEGDGAIQQALEEAFARHLETFRRQAGPQTRQR